MRILGVVVGEDVTSGEALSAHAYLIGLSCRDGVAGGARFLDLAATAAHGWKVPFPPGLAFSSHLGSGRGETARRHSSYLTCAGLGILLVSILVFRVWRPHPSNKYLHR